MGFQIKGDVLNGVNISATAIHKQPLSAPIMISFDVTNRCNFKCLHCFNNSTINGREDELSSSDRLNIAKQIRDLKPYIVCLCGGETTCCKELFEIISIISETVPAVNMVTNGYLISLDYAKKLKESGISLVQVSLDGINAEQHDTFRGKKGAFEHAIQAIQNLRSIGLNVATSLVPNKLNYKSTLEYFRLCNRLGVYQARSMPYLPIGRGKLLGNNLILNEEEYFVFQRQLQQAKDEMPEMDIEWGDPIDHLYRLPANAIAGMDTFSLDIKSNGDIGISAYLPIVVGNSLRHPIKEYWDAGLNKIWSNPKVHTITSMITNINDFEKLSKVKLLEIDILGGGK